MDKMEAIKRLEICQDNPDFETAHEEADDIVMEFLIEAGYKEVADAYNNVYKRYS